MRVKLLHKKFLNLVEVFGKFLATVDDCLELLLFVEVFTRGPCMASRLLNTLAIEPFTAWSTFADLAATRGEITL